MNTYISVIASLLAVCYGQLQGPSGHLGRDSFTVVIQVASEQRSCQVPNLLPGITVTVPRGASALNALETAAQSNPLYTFNVQYKRRFGYIINKFSGVSATSSCKWVLLVEPNGQSQPTLYTQRGLNFYQIPVTDTYITLNYTMSTSQDADELESGPSDQYMDFMSQPKYSITTYSVNMNGLIGTSGCAVSGKLPKKFRVNIEIGQSLQNALERAADRCPRYEFRAHYSGADDGYGIIGIGSVSLSGNCLVCTMYEEPQSGSKSSTIFVTNYVVPVDGGSIQFVYSNDHCGGEFRRFYS